MLARLTIRSPQLHAKFTHSLRAYSTSYQPSYRAPSFVTRKHMDITRVTLSSPLVNDLQNLTIEEMVATLTPLQKKCLDGMALGAMSYGSISLEAHEMIAEAANRIAKAKHGVTSMSELKKLPGIKGPISNSGEGGELKRRNNTDKQSRIKQVASARFGVNGAYLAAAEEIQIKISQGAKPGIGGELPGKKVTQPIAEARLTVPGITLASPPPHHDIYSIEDLKQLIRNLRSANPHARITVKLAASDSLGVIAAGVAKCGADGISIAGPGGTGAAPTTAKYEFVHPWEQALAEVHQTLVAEGLRNSVKLTVSGGIQTGLDHFKALLLGADIVEVGTSVLVSLGCVMAEVCHEGTCPTGIATTDQQRIDDNFKGTPDDVARSLIQTTISLSTYLEKYGFTDPEQAIGRTDLLQVKDNTPLTGLEKLLFKPRNPFLSEKTIAKDSGSSYEEQTIIWGIHSGKDKFTLEASNQILTFGARIGFHIHNDEDFKRAYYEKPVTVIFNGLSCGQSFGFVAPENLTLIAENANDGTGGLLDGATIYIKNVAGNVTGFGATRGHIFVKEAGGRAATRNSGAHMVAEKLGADAAGFMTGGTLTILANEDYYPGLDKKKVKSPFLQQDVIGPNFGSGFTGGIAYLPIVLYKKMLNENFLSPSSLEIKPQKLTDEELTDLIERLKAYRKEIDSDIVDALLSLDRNKLHHYFLKLDPSVKHAHKITPESNQIFDSLVDDHMPAEQVVDALNLIKPGETSSSQPKTGLQDTNAAEKDACGTGVLLNRDGIPTHQLVTDSVTMLSRFMHRGASGIDPETGDGCGITWYGLEHFFHKKFPHLELEKGNFAVVHTALPVDLDEQAKALRLLKEQLARENLEIVGERDVPVNNRVLGYIGKELEPAMKQFIVKKPSLLSQEEFDKKLIRAHLRMEFLTQQNIQDYTIRPHIISATSNNVIYKAMAKENKIGEYFLDFKDPEFTAHAAVTHARFSTNTFPSFMNIQLFRNLGNNGENNALQPIINALTRDPLLKDLLSLEIIDLTGFSDSHIMSIYMDMLRLEGYSAEDIVAFTIHAYDPSHSSTSEFYNIFGDPLEGPNAIIVTIGNKILVVRDRNGFRPQRGVINVERFYCGSELGTVDIQGDVFNLEPAKPIVIDLENKTIQAYQPDIEQQIFQDKQIKRLKKCIFTTGIEPLTFSQSELGTRKIRAGWSEEIDEKIIQPLFKNGKDAIVSMGDQRPTESLVRKSHFDIGAFLKGKFSQVTNPPLDSKREKEYMSTRTFIGSKPSLNQVGKTLANGFLLPSPIVNNHEMSLLMQSKILHTHTINIIFAIQNREESLKLAIENICQEAVQQAKKGTTFLVLSDLAIDESHAAIPAVIISSFVHEALLKAGLRRQISIGLQSASTITPRDIAQVISIGGVDVINPYLPFIASNVDDMETFRNQCDNYQSGLANELLGIMARVGISTVSAYRGTKAFNAYGFDSDLAKSLGIRSDLGGIGLREISTMVITQHQQPKPEGLGRLNSESDEREKIWDAHNTRAFIERARGNRDNNIEHRMDLLKRGTPRGQFFLRPSHIWTKRNPMTICILGGGAAAFYQAQSLLDADIPIRIIIIEQSNVNRFGLVGDGIAPDHMGTKNQARILREVLNDTRVNYYGGLTVGKDISFYELKSTYPCIIDCRGAAIDMKLNVPGETSKCVVPASVVYKGYNNTFDPLQHAEDHWPFFHNSKNPEIGIIGNGNVAADIARIFLKDVNSLKKTNISPRFLSLLESDAPDCVRIFARGAPNKSKISINELEQLKELKDVWLTASFDETKIDLSKSNEEEKNIYEFFLAIKDQSYPTSYTKRLHFHFNCTPKSFAEKGKEIEATFTGPNQEVLYFRARTFVTSIGSQPQPLEQLDERQIYASGWVTGKGGKLSSAERSAEETTIKIKTNFRNGVFNHTQAPANEQSWQLNSSVCNQEQLNILDYLEEGFHIETINDFRHAKQYHKPTSEVTPIVTTTADQILTSFAPPVSKVPTPEKDKVMIYDPLTEQTQYYNSNSDETLLAILKRDNNAPSCQCNGDQQCGECLVIAINNPIQATKKEEKLIKANGQDPNKNILSCARKMRELGYGVFVSPKEMKKPVSESELDTNKTYSR